MAGEGGAGTSVVPGAEPALTGREALQRLRADGRSTALTAVLLVIGATVLVAAIAVRFPDMSGYDEPAHLDYVLRAEQGELPRMGDRIQPEVVDAVLCRGIARVLPQDCETTDLRPARIGADGYQYEAQQPPVYYALTGAMRRLIALGPSDDIVLTARLTGIAWLIAGLGVLWLALARLHVRPLATATILAVALLSPAVLYHSATVTNDAAVLLLGALGLHFLFASRATLTMRAMIGWSFVGALMVWTKPQILLALVVMALVALLRRDRPGWRPVRDDLWALPVGVAALSYLVWGAVMDARATVAPGIVLDALLSFKQTTDFPTVAVIRQLVGLIGAYVAPSPLVPGFVLALGTLVTYVIIGGDLRAVLDRARASLAGLTGWLSLLGASLAGPAFTVLFFVQFDVGDGPSPRYGLVFLPGMLLGLVEPVSHRKGRLLLHALLAGLAAGLLVLLVDPTLRTR